MKTPKSSDPKLLKARRLVGLNQDSRQYFYEKADESHLEWLWENGFFHKLRKKSEDLTGYSYKTPELHYLVRMAKLKPSKVVDIILDTPISTESFNPEVVDQFLHICSELPGQELAKLINKIHDERWPVLMAGFSQWGVDYGKMFASLEESRNFKELLTLARAVFAVRDKNGSGYWETPFYLQNISYTRIFQQIANVPSPYLGQSLQLALSVLTEVTLTKKTEEVEFTFPIRDPFPLYDANIFDLGLRSDFRNSSGGDVRELVALIKALAIRLLGENCENEDQFKEIYEKYEATVPNSQLTWRLRLFLLSLCPESLKNHLKDALFRLFNVARYGDILYGAEYKTTLQKTFFALSDQDKRGYIHGILNLFSPSKTGDDYETRLRDGSRILSLIKDHLTEKEKENLRSDGFDLSLDYTPSPVIGQVISGWVKAQGPITLDEINQLPVTNIAQNLREVWTPENLRKLDSERDFLNPLNAEGMGELIREDIKLRLPDYLKHASVFFDRNEVDLHYTYSLLSGIEKAIDSSNERLSTESWSELIEFCLAIKNSIEASPADRVDTDAQVDEAWLGRWNAIHRGIVDVLIKALSEKGKSLGFDLRVHRQNVYSLTSYLFKYPDPNPEDESLETAKMTVSSLNEPPLVSDPFTLAINSIRGRTYELFVTFVDNEAASFPVESTSKISTDLKRLYEEVLRKEDTRAIMFLFGHYVPTFFFKDRSWLKNILADIFPYEQPKVFQYLAAWEGYLVNNLFVEIFNDIEFRNLYDRALGITNPNYPNQKHFLDPDEGLAQHIALAYMHSQFGFGDDLFDRFLENMNLKRHIAFVDKLGRLYISGENPQANNLLQENPAARRKLKLVWDWVLEKHNDPVIFEAFGFWVNLEKEIFTPNELAERLILTLRRTGGYLEWDLGLVENIAQLAQNSPTETLEIARLFLLEGSVRSGKNRVHFTFDENWIEVFGNLYKNTSTRPQTVLLISELIREGGRLYWPLKDILGTT